MLWLVYFESANYAGYGEHRIVEADSEDVARDIITPIAEGFYREEDGDQLEEDGYDLDDCTFASILSVEEFTPDHNDWDLKDTFEKVN